MASLHTLALSAFASLLIFSLQAHPHAIVIETTPLHTPPPALSPVPKPSPHPAPASYPHHHQHPGFIPSKKQPPSTSSRFKLGKMLGIALVSVAGVLQAVVVVFLLVKRRQILKIVRSDDRNGPLENRNDLS